MNKTGRKYSVIAAIVLIFSVATAKALTPEELANYEAIKSALKARDYNQNSVQIAADIACIEKHITEQEALKNSWKLFIPSFLSKLFGGGFGLAAGIGALATTVGTVGGVAMFGAGAYKDALSLIYFMALPQELGFIPRDTASLEKARHKIGQKVGGRKSPIGESEELLLMSMVAPAVGTASLISAGISRYLFNKAARYKEEIERLEKEIAEDRVFVEELKRKLPAQEN